MENVMIVPTPDYATGRVVLRKLDELGEAKAIEVRGAAVVKRAEDGRWHLPEERENVSYRGVVTGGALGALIGLVAGPAGVLLGGAAGLLVASSTEIADSQNVESIVHALGRLIPPGATAVVCDVLETTPDELNAALTGLGVSGWRMTRREAEVQLNAALYRDDSAFR